MEISWNRDNIFTIILNFLQMDIQRKFAIWQNEHSLQFFFLKLRIYIFYEIQKKKVFLKIINLSYNSIE